jgi:hypothetical protein
MLIATGRYAIRQKEIEPPKVAGPPLPTLGGLERTAMRARFVCAVLLALALTGEAFSGVNSPANDVMPGCRAVISDFGTSRGSHHELMEGFCVGVVAALFQRGRDICPPQGATVEQALRIVVHHIDTRPESLRESFYDLATEALRTAFPCPAHR